MALVQYSSSSDSESNDDEIEKEAKCDNTGENEDDHQGRVRSFPHERGNWASYIFIPYVKEESMNDLQCDMLEYLKKKKINNIHLMEDLHMSLSRTVILKLHWLDSFSTGVKECLSNKKPFQLTLNEVRVYANDEKTRTFISLAIPDNQSFQLENVQKKFDDLYKEYSLPVFYENPSYHISILWCIGDKTEQLHKHVARLQLIFDDYLESDYSDFALNVTSIQWKMGNKLKHCTLKN